MPISGAGKCPIYLSPKGREVLCGTYSLKAHVPSVPQCPAYMGQFFPPKENKVSQKCPKYLQ